jgi:SAM-dependent methyltransferase
VDIGVAWVCNGLLRKGENTVSTNRSERLELARLYSMLHQGVEGDVAWYKEQCRGGSDVLELGCGYGRLLGELAAAGACVTGLDFAPAMLELAEQNLSVLPPDVRSRVRLVEADMRSFHLDRQFDRILIPFNGLYCLPNDRAVRDCFDSVRHHLAEGGRLIFDAYRVHPEDEPQGNTVQDEPFEHLVTLQDGSETIEVHERDCWDPQRKTIAATYLFTRKVEGVPRQVRETIQHRYLGLETVLQLLEESGFQLLEESGGFQSEALDQESDWLVIVAEVS